MVHISFWFKLIGQKRTHYKEKHKSFSNCQ